ncbi:DNA topology modulation protein [Virgibacillus pantothenticus]|uniref:DNA topology modulation protein n=1 Tax=Virgibacillus pantothenticus TaxID=1473 RepID=UPI001C24772B|nr:DNA topology modulation protein [Virgibacillus pantothenticus]MBU8566835.1 DNA topology modulation protein [Virgibacillus pantothenticus]MBU8600472.1 DNA topology modulation protein [Virgibacillus pantothenticus]MBU8635133.1 DNA topology modulation protein [Virgibacillus pantothenticus]MBU8642554.1 DNA topology modulation protein [Virgibacillus pantothenticus]MBU8646759.1 DNA topology modulation protein [Virgibacillus pantothenticus]
MKKIMIIGNPGSGKSTLARKLSDLLGIPAYHMNTIFWQPGWVPIKREKLVQETKKLMEKDAWIIDGNYGATMDIRLKEADTIILLHFSTIRCLYGITKRRIQYHNRTRPDLTEGCPEKLDREFFQWVRKFNKRKAPHIYERLANYPDKRQLIFKNRTQLQKFLQKLS